MEKKLTGIYAFICQTQGLDKLQPSLDAKSIFVSQVDQIKNLRHMNLLSIPLKMNTLRGNLELGHSLIRLAAKFHKSYKLKFGNEKLDKAMKKFEKQEKPGKLSTSQGRCDY